MAESDQRVAPKSATYREFARLYDVARQLRPTAVDRWNGELYATRSAGGFDQETGAIGIHEPLLREGLTQHATVQPRQQARALATVLERASSAGMELDAPGEANAVRTQHSLALMEGVASVRAAADFHNFSKAAGYPRLPFDGHQHSGAYTATNGLIQQAAGQQVDSHDLIDRLSQGPAALHFDRLAEGVVRNRLEEVAPAEGAGRRAMRAELIGAMLHPRWEELARRSPEAGRQVAEEIGQALNSKVDELRQRYQQTGRATGGDGAFQRDAQRAHEPTPHQTGRKAQEVPAARFFSGIAPAAGAPGGRALSLGDGSRTAAARASAPMRGASPPGQHPPSSPGRR